MPLETVDLCFRPGVDPVKESLRIQKLIKEGKMDQVTLVGHQRAMMAEKSTVEVKEHVAEPTP
jgi:hypothetical protein